jgi:signal peptidase II
MEKTSVMRAWHWLWITAVVLVLDLVTKAFASDQLALHQAVPVIDGFFNLTLMHNTGAAFSFLSDASGWQRWFFTIVALLVSAGIVYWLWRMPASQRWVAIALALILGGALGNLWDRITLGYVVDFIQIYYDHWYWPAFNIADSAITIGAIILIADSLFNRESKPSASDSKTSD